MLRKAIVLAVGKEPPKQRRRKHKSTIRQKHNKRNEASPKHKGTYHLVVVKSTVVPGTTGKIVKPILEKHSRQTKPENF